MMSATPRRALLLALSIPLSSITTVLHGGTPPAKETVIEREAHPIYRGTITGGVKTSDVYTEANFSIVAPVWSTLGADATLSGDIIYLEPYTSWGERGEVAASLGLGWRHLFGSQSVSVLNQHDDRQAGFLEEGIFVGANVFIDMLDTEADNQFWQLGVGMEVGTRYVELRGNYYIPLSDRQLAEETRVRQSFTSSQADTRIVAQQAGAPGPLTAAGNGIGHDVNVTTTSVTTIRTTTTTIEQLFRRYEEGMEGWDTEFALLIPWLDRYFDFRVIGGYYKFDNQPFGPQEGGTGNVEGWKAGVEIRPVPAVILTGTWYEDERLTGSDWTVGVQLQIPFEAGDLGDGKDFWERIGDSFKPRRRHLIERLAEPVHRQNAAIKLASEVEEETEEVSQKTSVHRVTRVTQSTQRIVIVDDVIFVNNGGPVGNGIAQAGVVETGSAAQPFNTIQEAADQAALNNAATQRVWTVYTQGAGAHGGSSYNESVTIGSSTRFISSATLVVSALGGIFSTGDRPLVNGGFGGDGGALFAGTTSPYFVRIASYEITGGYQSAASVSALVPGTPYANGTGIRVDNFERVEIEDNQVHDTPFIGIVASNNLERSLNALIRNNHVRDTDLGISIGAGAGGASLTAQVEGNTAEYNTDEGMIVSGLGSVFASISGNTIVNNGGSGLIFGVGGPSVGDVHDNVLSGNGRYGLAVYADYVSGNISRNVANLNGTVGIAFSFLNEGNAAVNVTDNITNFNGENGLELTVHVFNGDITNNTAQNNGLSGIRLSALTVVLPDLSYSPGSITSHVTGNITNDNYTTGFGVYGPSFSGSFTGNVSNSNDDHGFETDVGAISIGPFDGNMATGNSGNNFNNLNQPLANP